MSSLYPVKTRVHEICATLVLHYLKVSPNSAEECASVQSLLEQT